MALRFQRLSSTNLRSREHSPPRLKRAPLRRSFRLLSRRQLRLIAILSVGFLFFLWTKWLVHDDYDYDMTWLDKDPDTASKIANGLMGRFKKQQPSSSGVVSKPRPAMTKSKDGLLYVGDWKGRHPLLELVDSAQISWKSSLADRPSKVLEGFQAYKSQQARSPPRSYQHFFSLSADALPATCLLPQADTVRLYEPLLPSTIHNRQNGLEGSPGTVTIIIRNGRVGRGFVSGQVDDTILRDSAQALVDIIAEDADELPNMRLTLSPLGPRSPIPRRLREDMEDLRNIGESFSESEGDWDEDGDGDGVYAFRGWTDACDRDSLLAQKRARKGSPISFIYTKKALSPCHHKNVFEVSPYFASPPPAIGVLSPVFSFTRTAIHGDVILPRPFTAEHVYGDKHRKVVKWDSKQSVLYWRGLAGFSDQHDEMTHPTNRLLNLLQSPVKSVTSNASILIPDGKDGFTVETDKDARELLHGMVDLAFEGCEDDHDCAGLEERYRFVEANQTSQWSSFKYVIDLDDEDGPSSQFRELLLSGSVVLKSSVFEDYWTNHAMPWVHYIPVQPDFSDLASIVLFLHAHDDIARSIAEAGQALAKDCFSKDGVRAGVFAVLSEYGRMWSLDRRDVDMVVWNEEAEVWE